MNLDATFFGSLVVRVMCEHPKQLAATGSGGSVGGRSREGGKGAKDRQAIYGHNKIG